MAGISCKGNAVSCALSCYSYAPSSPCPCRVRATPRSLQGSALAYHHRSSCKGQKRGCGRQKNDHNYQEKWPRPKVKNHYYNREKGEKRQCRRKKDDYKNEREKRPLICLFNWFSTYSVILSTFLFKNIRWIFFKIGAMVWKLA